MDVGGLDVVLKQNMKVFTYNAYNNVTDPFSDYDDVAPIHTHTNKHIKSSLFIIQNGFGNCQ